MEQIATWLGQESPAASARFLENCLADFERLAAAPFLGPSRPFRHPDAINVRSWIVGGFPNHLIFYRPVEDGVEILHVLHGARNIAAIFEDDAGN